MKTNTKENRMCLTGYDLLGESGNDGIRYAWKIHGYNEILESAAFVYKTKGIINDVSGYTTSVSLGCILQKMGIACRFCRTGMLHPYRVHLKGDEIALQNVLMVLTDMNCDDRIELATRLREFAYMGQGEPGYSYPQVKRAIQITDLAMAKLGQKVYRHIYSTAGVEESLYCFYEDLTNNAFSSKVTLHFSLHSLVTRNFVMPIENIYPVHALIPLMEKISREMGEKISLGLILFKDFQSKCNEEVINTEFETVQRYCHMFNPEFFRFSLCEFNDAPELGRFGKYKSEDANRIKEYLQSEGYEAKLFYSFGRKENTACGMLAGKEPEKKVSKKWGKLLEEAKELVKNCSGEI